MMSAAHIPVLRSEVLGFLEPHSGGVYADVTLGRGGHAESILEASFPDGRVVGLDRDKRALEETGARLASFGERVSYVHSRFSRLPEAFGSLGIEKVDGLVADLGVSSPQLDQAERGFSFGKDGPLDMRMDTSSGLSAKEFIEETSEKDLADVLFRFGEERKSRAIARSIKFAVADGRLETTLDLRRAVVRVLGPSRRGGIDPATRTFQAVRIAVNEELGELTRLLEVLPDVLNDSAVAVIISFHSLEDRIVKHTLRSQQVWEMLTKRPVTATDLEAVKNPRSRSAKLRAVRRMPRSKMHQEAES